MNLFDSSMLLTELCLFSFTSLSISSLYKISGLFDLSSRLFIICFEFLGPCFISLCSTNILDFKLFSWFYSSGLPIFYFSPFYFLFCIILDYKLISFFSIINFIKLSWIFYFFPSNLYKNLVEFFLYMEGSIYMF